MTSSQTHAVLTVQSVDDSFDLMRYIVLTNFTQYLHTNEMKHFSTKYPIYKSFVQVH